MPQRPIPARWHNLLNVAWCEYSYARAHLNLRSVNLLRQGLCLVSRRTLTRFHLKKRGFKEEIPLDTRKAQPSLGCLFSFFLFQFSFIPPLVCVCVFRIKNTHSLTVYLKTHRPLPAVPLPTYLPTYPTYGKLKEKSWDG